MILTAVGKKWHKPCFTCTSCDTPLAGGQFFNVDGSPYCAPCAEKATAPPPTAPAPTIRCKACKYVEHIEVGRPWPRPSLTSRPIPIALAPRPSPLAPRPSALAPTLRDCSKPIKGEFTKAYGFDWHNDCLVCAHCKKPISNDGLYDDDLNKPVHLACLK